MANCSADYDLAILGGSISSRLAACTAARKGARVALIMPTWHVSDAMQGTLHVLLGEEAVVSDLKTTWSNLAAWLHYQCEYSRLSPTVLRTHGIDVILEPVSFEGNRCLRLNDRRLKASRYLLTDGYSPSVAHYDSLPCYQLTQLDAVPKRIAVVGNGAIAVEWAYALSRVAHVTLISSTQGLLPSEDDDIQRLSEALLRSLGVNVVYGQGCSNSGDASKSSDVSVVVKQARVEHVIAIPQTFAWDNMGLDTLGIASGLPILVNRYLQTVCPQVYASGSSLGGERRSELTQQETAIALDNVLFGRWHVMRYEQAYYSIRLLSPIGRWGLTERQARQRYGSSVVVLQASCLSVRTDHAAQTNFCKLIILGARVVGIHLMGEGAPTLVVTMGQMPTMPALSRWAMGNFQLGTLRDAIYQTIEQWQDRRWAEGQWRRDWAENWLNWRRSR